jgi:hypothetical protein
VSGYRPDQPVRAPDRWLLAILSRSDPCATDGGRCQTATLLRATMAAVPALSRRTRCVFTPQVPRVSAVAVAVAIAVAVGAGTAARGSCSRCALLEGCDGSLFGYK